MSVPTLYYLERLGKTDIGQFLEGFCEFLSTGEAAFLPTTWLPQAAAELGGKCVESACAGVGGADHGRTCCRPTSLQHLANPTSNLEFQEEQEPFFFFFWAQVTLSLKLREIPGEDFGERQKESAPRRKSSHLEHANIRVGNEFTDTKSG